MSRWVVPQREGLKTGGSEGPDGALGRVVKFVPSEVVSAFTLLFTVLAAMSLPPNQRLPAAVGLIVLFFVVTIAYIAVKVPRGPVRTAHLVVSPFAFIAWAYPISSSLLGGAFVGLISFAAQAIVIALSIFIAPRE